MKEKIRRFTNIVVKLVQKILITIFLSLVYFIGFGLMRIIMCLFRGVVFKEQPDILNSGVSIKDALRQS